MINILIAEDQQLILKDLYNKILKSDSDINIVATAINGQDAYEKVLEFKPDIVFTDISMPIMNGIDMIKKVKESNIDCKFVIISGYKEFDYAREAIKVGVDEYLLKPIVIDDIKNILDNLKSKIFMKQKDYEQHLVDSLIDLDIIHQPKVSINFNFQNYYVLLFNAGPYSSFTIDYITLFSKIWSEIDLIDISKNYISNDEKIFLTKGKYSNEMICVFATNESNVNNLINFSEKIIEIGASKNIFITSCISRKIKHIENIGIQSQILRTIMKKNIIFSKSLILDCSNIEMHLYSHRFFLTDDIEKRIKFYLQNNKKYNFISECKNLVNILKENNATQMEIDKCFKGLIDRCPINYFVKDNASDIELKIDECISTSKNYHDLSSKLCIIFAQSADEFTKSNSKHTDIEDIINASKEFIKNNFSQEIGINEIANTFTISPTYFSRLFKKQVGVPPIVYLTNYRIKKACEMLSESNFTVKEISELCGYSDQFYFSKTFKTIIGIPPSEYKLRNSK